MNGRRTGVDEAHAMTPSLRYLNQQDELTELLSKAAGRFGREVRVIACPDPEQGESRKMEVENMRTRLKKSGYDVDPRLVAAAILERLTAGGVSPTEQRKRTF
jgi:hypothetical protein